MTLRARVEQVAGQIEDLHGLLRNRKAPIWRACGACHLVFCVGVPEGAPTPPCTHCPACGSDVLRLLEKA